MFPPRLDLSGCRWTAAQPSARFTWRAAHLQRRPRICGCTRTPRAWSTAPSPCIACSTGRRRATSTAACRCAALAAPTGRCWTRCSARWWRPPVPRRRSHLQPSTAAPTSGPPRPVVERRADRCTTGCSQLIPPLPSSRGHSLAGRARRAAGPLWRRCRGMSGRSSALRRLLSSPPPPRLHLRSCPLAGRHLRQQQRRRRRPARRGRAQSRVPAWPSRWTRATTRTCRSRIRPGRAKAGAAGGRWTGLRARSLAARGRAVAGGAAAGAGAAAAGARRPSCNGSRCHCLRAAPRWARRRRCGGTLIWRATSRAPSPPRTCRSGLRAASSSPTCWSAARAVSCRRPTSRTRACIGR
mmetsp:Transcript_19422/g.48982  ORF Transcript_19422/g.48982 Transcript_19422/m.48982 type:complete len:354 (+) Transcript_19422:243-1304(+)